MAKKQSYEGAAITVGFDGARCIHARRCVLGLPSVKVETTITNPHYSKTCIFTAKTNPNPEKGKGILLLEAVTVHVTYARQEGGVITVTSTAEGQEQRLQVTARLLRAQQTCRLDTYEVKHLPRPRQTPEKAGKTEKKTR